MSTLTPEAEEERSRRLKEAIAGAANRAVRAWRGFVDRDDLVQEGWVWALTHPNKAASLLEAEDGERADRMLGAELRRAMERHARDCKAASLGYRPEDEYFYDTGLVEAMLPYVMHGSSPSMEEYALMSDPGRVSHMPGRRVPPRRGAASDGMDPAVSYIDVETAFFDLSASDRRLLWLLFGPEGLTQEEVAHASKTVQATIARRKAAALRRMVRSLGGRRPVVRGDSPVAQQDGSDDDGQTDQQSQADGGAELRGPHGPA